MAGTNMREGLCPCEPRGWHLPPCVIETWEGVGQMGCKEEESVGQEGGRLSRIRVLGGLDSGGFGITTQKVSVRWG